MTLKKRIWALLDERQGNTSQTLGVAEALGLPFETKHIAFNPWIRLPNLLINTSTLGIDKTSLNQLQEPWPDIVIATARRLGIVASYIKSKNPNCFLAQVQWPGWPSAQFDLIAAPQHDHVRPGSTIMQTLGAPHRVTPEILRRDAEVWRPRVSTLPPPKIAVLVGGSNRGWAFTPEHAGELGSLASKLATAMGGSLLITTSRRTGSELAAAMEVHLSCPYFMHTPKDGDTPDSNPYYGFLGLADAVIATGDSISMCSEACATGKPVFVYAKDGFVSPKHREFIDAIYAKGLARPLAGGSLQPFTPPYRLDDASLIAEEIRRRAVVV